MSPLLSVTTFIVLGVAFVFGNLTLGALVRPKVPSPEKGAAYECGEPAIGPNHVQFDPRFYVIALVYLVFDVEVALTYPWAVAYGDAAAVAARVGQTLFQVRAAALVDLLIFFGLLLVGFAHLWQLGQLDWVRPTPAPRVAGPRAGGDEAIMPTGYTDQLERDPAPALP